MHMCKWVRTYTHMFGGAVGEHTKQADTAAIQV